MISDLYSSLFHSKLVYGFTPMNCKSLIRSILECYIKDKQVGFISMIDVYGFILMFFFI